jgi:hypothetical protein
MQELALSQGEPILSIYPNFTRHDFLPSCLVVTVSGVFTMMVYLFFVSSHSNCDVAPCFLNSIRFLELSQLCTLFLHSCLPYHIDMRGLVLLPVMRHGYCDGCDWCVVVIVVIVVIVVMSVGLSPIIALIFSTPSLMARFSSILKALLMPPSCV